MHFTLVKAGAIAIKKSKIPVEQYHVSLCKQVLGIRKAASNIQVLAELHRLPFKTYTETQMFKYLQRLPYSCQDLMVIMNEAAPKRSPQEKCVKKYS